VLGGLVSAAVLAVWQLAPLVRTSAALAISPGTDPSQALVALVVLLCATLVGAWWLWLLGSTVVTVLLPRVQLPPAEQDRADDEEDRGDVQQEHRRLQRGADRLTHRPRRLRTRIALRIQLCRATFCGP